MFKIVFSPYTTEVHREYVSVAGHGAWLAVLFLHENVLWVLIRSTSEVLLMSTHNMFPWRNKKNI